MLIASITGYRWLRMRRVRLARAAEFVSVCLSFMQTDCCKQYGTLRLCSHHTFFFEKKRQKFLLAFECDNSKVDTSTAKEASLNQQTTKCAAVAAAVK